MAKPKTITLTETDLPDADRELALAFVAAKRAQKQAEAALEKLAPGMLKLARKHPGLLVDGARITVGKHTTWKYSEIVAGMQGSVAALLEEERDNGTAKEKVTYHPQLRELSKFTGQAIGGMSAGIWNRIFKKG